MRTRLTTFATLTMLTVACSTASPSTTPPIGGPDHAGRPAGQPPAVHATGQDRGPPSPHTDIEVADEDRDAPADTHTQSDPAHAGAPRDPAAEHAPSDAAAGMIVELLAAEGLLVTSIDTHVEADDGDRAQVQVDVAHSPGHGHPVQSRYRLELVRDAGRWELVAFTEPG